MTCIQHSCINFLRISKSVFNTNEINCFQVSGNLDCRSWYRALVSQAAQFVHTFLCTNTLHDSHGY